MERSEPLAPLLALSPSVTLAPLSHPGALGTRSPAPLPPPDRAKPPAAPSPSPSPPQTRNPHLRSRKDISRLPGLKAGGPPPAPVPPRRAPRLAGSCSPGTTSPGVPHRAGPGRGGSGAAWRWAAAACGPAGGCCVPRGRGGRPPVGPAPGAG